jgi:hypothetical protein
MKRFGAVKNARKPSPAPSASKGRDNPDQSRRFIEAAKEAGAAAPGEFERAFKTLALPKKTERRLASRPK